SSRRRHTRLVSDWSSDVCSSDLSGWPAEWTESWNQAPPINVFFVGRILGDPLWPDWGDPRGCQHPEHHALLARDPFLTRSNGKGSRRLEVEPSPTPPAITSDSAFEVRLPDAPSLDRIVI